jgi:hypothetical protein
MRLRKVGRHLVDCTILYDRRCSTISIIIYSEDPLLTSVSKVRDRHHKILSLDTVRTQIHIL